MIHITSLLFRVWLQFLSWEVLYTESLRRMSFAWSRRSSWFFHYRVCRFHRLSSVLELPFFELLPLHWSVVSGESPAVPHVHVREPEGQSSKHLNDAVGSRKGWLAFQDFRTWLLHANQISKTEGWYAWFRVGFLPRLLFWYLAATTFFLSSTLRFHFLLEYFVGPFKASWSYTLRSTFCMPYIGVVCPME